MSVFSIRLCTIDEVNAGVQSIIGYLNGLLPLDEEKTLDIRLVLSEIIFNCFIHGNCSDLLPVIVNTEIIDDKIDFYVSHLSRDFETRIETLNRKMAESTPSYSESGRGMLIVSSICETVIIRENGIYMRISNK